MPQKKAIRKILARLRKKQWKRTAWGFKKRSTVNVNRALQPFSQRYISKMKYSESFQLTGPGLAGFVTQRMNLNSIFDPNRTGLGHQPYGHDTMATLYNRYRVVKCNYSISAIALGQTTANMYSVIAALPANEEVSISNVSEAQENPRCKYITQAPNAGLKVLRGTVYLPSLVGRSKAQYMADDRYQSQYGSSPNELAVLNIYAGLLNGANETTQMSLNVTLEYVVESFDVKALPQS